MIENYVKYLLEKFKDFESTPKHPYPSSSYSFFNTIYTSNSYDMAAILTERKPAALLDYEIDNKYSSKLDKELLRKCIEKGCIYKKLENKNNGIWFVIGIKDNVNRIEDIFNNLLYNFRIQTDKYRVFYKYLTETEKENSIKIQRLYHIELGRSLGYSELAIQEFLERVLKLHN